MCSDGYGSESRPQHSTALNLTHKVLTMFRTIKRNWFNLLQRLLDAVYGFTCVVEWEGKGYTHKAPSLDDAIDWLSQYPASASGVILNGDNEIIAGRFA